MLFASGAITFYEGNNNVICPLVVVFGPYAMDRNNYI
jgi:hypothetical protein